MTNMKTLAKKSNRGAIVLAEIRGHSVEVEFFDLPKNVYELQCIYVEDLEVTHGISGNR